MAASKKKIKKKKIVSKKTSVNEGSEIIKLILDDHKPLKKFIQILKNLDKPISERQRAFDEFSSILFVHSHAEEEALYKILEHDDELRAESFEGEVEHQLAEDILHAAQSEQDKDMWSAKVKVLAELVEHHIEEEESELLPEVKNEISLDKRREFGERYLEMKEQFERSDEGMKTVQALDENFEDKSEQKPPQVVHH